MFLLEKNWQFGVPDFGVWSVVIWNLLLEFVTAFGFVPLSLQLLLFFFWGFSVNSFLSQQGFGFATIFCHFLEGFFYGGLNAWAANWSIGASFIRFFGAWDEKKSKVYGKTNACTLIKVLLSLPSSELSFMSKKPSLL